MVPVLTSIPGIGELPARTLLAEMTFPAAHRVKLHSTNPMERLNGEINRRTEGVGIFPNEAAITSLVGAIQGGRAVLHYSNMHWMHGAVYGEAPHMRNFFSENMMIHFAHRKGLNTIRHTTLDWGARPVYRSLDGLSVLEKT